jgi:hypothetical protein
MEFVLLKIGSPEWNHIWKWLEEHPMNKDYEQPSVVLNDSEAWQYVGTYRKGNEAYSDFRHKKHPLHKDVVIVSVKHEISDEGIEKKFRL